MGQKRVRCPVCGLLAWRSQIEKYHDIDILEQNRVVRPKGSGGFKFTKSEDPGLVALVRSKIKNLYEMYFLNSSSLFRYGNRLDHLFMGDTGKPTSFDKGGLDI